MVGFTLFMSLSQVEKKWPNSSFPFWIRSCLSIKALLVQSCLCKETVTSQETKVSGVTQPHSSVQTALGCPTTEDKSESY